MNLRNHWGNYEEYTRIASTNSKKAAYAIGAICWAFQTKEGFFQPLVYGALFFLVLFFIFDVFQYLVGAANLRNWLYKYEKENPQLLNSDKPILKKRKTVKWVNKIFYIKMFLLFISIGFILTEIVIRGYKTF